MNIEHKPLPASQPLAEALIHRYEEVRRFYEYDATRKDEWVRRMDWLKTHESGRIERSRLAETLRQYNQKYNAHEAVMHSIELFEHEQAAVIVGGQQCGLLTGPLLVIYKALSIIKAAREAQKELSHPVVPVFWIAGEDHDWEEADHADLLSAEQQLRRIRIPRKSDLRSPVSWTELAAGDWETAADELENLLQDTEFKPEIMQVFRSAAAESSTLAECFARLMGTLFGKYGLILMDSADPALRRLESPVFAKMIIGNDELESSYFSAAEALENAGFHLQADVHEGGANLFYIHEGERLLLFKKDGLFTDRKQTCSFTRDQLLSMLEQHPERFSNNVLTRPLMQDALLPVLGAVLGAGEISYWALTGQAFVTFGMQMPLLIPRESFTVMDGAVRRNMEKYGLAWEDVSSKDILAGKREAWLKEQDALHLEERFSEIKDDFASMYNPLIEQLGLVQAGLVKLGGANRDKILEQIDYLRNKAMDALAKSNEAGLRHFERMELTVIPGGKLQERVYNVFYYINRYGWGWIDEVAGIPYDVTGSHRIINM